MTALLSPVTKAVSNVVSTAAKVTFGAVDKLLITPINNLVLKPLGGIIKIAGKAVAAPFKLISDVTTAISVKVSDAVTHVRNFMYEVGKKVKEDIINSKPVQFLKRAVETGREFVEEMIHPVIDLGKAAIGEVKKAIKNSIKNFFSSILDAFKTVMNPFNWIKAVGKIGGGLASLILGKEGAEKVKGFFGKLNPFRERGETRGKHSFLLSVG